MVAEPNNLISEAIESGIGASGESNDVFSSSIDAISDIDIYKFQLNAGQGITLDIDTSNAANNTTNFDSYLRVFDTEGNELASNDDFSLDSEEFSLDSYIGFIANQTGEYYVGVSSIGNNSYNPVNGDNVNQFQDNFVPGDYDLTFDIVEVIADEDIDNTISEPNIPNLDLNSSVTANKEIETESDVDIFKVELEEGEGIKLRVDAKAIDSNLDSYLRVFDALGNELAFNDNTNNNPTDEITTDSTIAFAPESPGEYYVGVSSAGNFDYDPINGNTNLNLSPNNGFSQGNYQLQLDVVEIISDEDPDNTIAEAVNSGVSSTGERSGVVNGEINPELDADLYQVQLVAGDGIYLDINTEESGSDLDSFLRIFDARGNELTFDDNDNGNITEDFSKDSAVAFAPDAAGDYYIGVSAAGNFDYDPVNGRNNFSSNLTSPFSTLGNYELQIDVAEVVADSDPDNTIAEAVDSGVSSIGETSGVLTETIDSAADIDLYQFQLEAGQGVTLNINAANSDLDSYLRLFDRQGNELAFDDDDDNNVVLEDTTSDSLINFIAETSGEYYVGVSSEGNTAYDAIAGSDNFNATSGLSAGNYELAIDIAPVVADSDPDNTIAEAVNTEVSITERATTTISDAIDSPADVDLYQFRLNQGHTITLDIDAAIIDSDLDSVLQLFDADGNVIVNNDDGVADGETSSLDSLIEYTAATAGTYYVGVSSFANFDYDAIEGSNNFSNDNGSSTGNYDLTVSVTNSTNTIEGSDEPEDLNGTAQPDIIRGYEGDDTISGGANPDHLFGRQGNDSLAGNDGDDVLQGGQNADTLLGGAGNDTLYGNTGADTFILTPENSLDTIVDFEDSTDNLRLPGNLSFEDLTIGKDSSGTSITVTTSDRTIATLPDINPTLITEADFAIDN